MLAITQKQNEGNTLVAQPSTCTLQRACACGKYAGNGGECAECRKKRLGLQRRAVGEGPEVAPPIVHDVLRSPGRPLDDATRGFMESRFNHDFSGVRVHTDGQAAASARAVNALAYTVGNHMAFDVGQFAPTTSAGRGLLTHELTHVVQQGGGPSATGHWPTSALSIGPRSSPLEQMAEQASRAHLAALPGPHRRPLLPGRARGPPGAGQPVSYTHLGFNGKV